ncbi:MAG: GNAT family N-acetyltransferase [Defluviitaleaceae bacterium]|nr:GNAT family N-acetyltransferase [Defluviitaleaceae bacterium]
MTLIDKMRECEIEYVKCFSKANNTSPDFIRFTDPLMPDMYSHNYTWVKSAGYDKDLLQIIRCEVADGKSDFCMIHCHIPVSENLLNSMKTWGTQPEVSVMGWYVYDISQKFNARDCDIRKLDKPEMVDDLLHLETENDGDVLGADFCQRRAERRAKVYLAEDGISSYICYHEGRAIGHCHLFVHGDTAKIEDFSVLEYHQRKGFGTAILKKMIDTALLAGATTIYLVTDEDDTAKEMYQKLGFSKVYECTELLFRF